MIYVPKFFKAEELVDPDTFHNPIVGGQTALRYFRPEILRAIDFVREFYPCKGPSRSFVVNNWHVGGEHQWRGLRLPVHPVNDTALNGSKDWKPFSAHSWGAGIDGDAKDCTADELRAWILQTADQVLREGHMDHPVLGIRRMEIGTSWAHLDCLQHNEPGIWMVKP